MKSRILALFAAAVSLSGCATSLSVSEVSMDRPTTQTGPSTLPAGFMYRLPAAVITPTAFVAIRDCPVDQERLGDLKAINPADAQPITEVKLVVGGAITTSQVPDKAILIDYRELQQFLKTSSVSLERHPNGMLKSINASMEDQTPQAIAALASTIGSVALLTAGAPPPGLPAAPGGVGGTINAANAATVNFLSCKPGTFDLVMRRKAAAQQIASATGLLDTAAAAAAKLGGQAGADQKTLDGLKADVAKYTAQLDKATAEMAEIDAQLTLPLDMVKDPATGATVALSASSGQVKPSKLRDGITLSSNQLSTFLAAHFVDASATIDRRKKADFDQRPCLWNKAAGTALVDETCSGIAAISGVLAKASEVKLIERSMTPIADGVTASPARSALGSVRKSTPEIPGQHVAANKGIIYVEPARLKVDLIGRTIGPASVHNPTRILKTADVSVPQLGRYLALPLRAGFGERVELQATFAEDGSLLTGTFAHPKNMGLAIAKALQGLGETAVSTRTAVEDRQLKELSNRAAALTSYVSIQDATKKLTPTTDPMADLNAQLARVTAEAAIAEAQVRIRAAEAKLVSP